MMMHSSCMKFIFLTILCPFSLTLSAHVVNPGSLYIYVNDTIETQSVSSIDASKPQIHLSQADLQYYTLMLTSKKTGKYHPVMAKILIDNVTNQRVAFPGNDLDYISLDGGIARFIIELYADSLREIPSGEYDFDFLVSWPNRGSYYIKESIELSGFERSMAFEIQLENSEWDISPLLDISNPLSYIDVPAIICTGTSNYANAELVMTSPSILESEKGDSLKYQVELIYSGAIGEQVKFSEGKPVKLNMISTALLNEDHNVESCQNYAIRLSSVDNIHQIPPGRYKQTLTFLLLETI